jgi:NAD+ kinase
MAAPAINSALVVYKKSAFDLYVIGRGNNEIPDAATRRAMLTAHENNARCIDEVKRVLDESGVRFRASSRTDLHPEHKTNGVPDLVISVGGDGTFLEASHQVSRGLIMGVNSSPDHSVGFFCAATRETFEKRLRRALDGRLPVTPMARLQVEIEGERVPHLALNDVLLTHQNPGATSRYVLKIGAHEEIQRSSGVWIATAAGSTAGIRTAGGALLPIRTDRIQYAVREMYTPPGEKKPKLLRGAVPGRPGIRIVSRMADGALFVDGPRHRYPLQIGTRVSVKAAPLPLRVLGFDIARRR